MRLTRLRGAVAACIVASSACCASAWSAAPSRQGESSWHVVGRDDGITVATRPLDGSRYPAVRASGTVCATLDTLVDFIEDATQLDRWIPDTVEARLLARPSKREQILYIRTSMPWPVAHRDMIYRLTEPTGQVGGDRMSVAIEGLPDYLPPMPGAVRMKRAEGRWTLQQHGRDTRIDLEMHFEPGGNIPSWLASKRIVDVPTKMLLNLNKRFASACTGPDHAALAPSD